MDEIKIKMMAAAAQLVIEDWYKKLSVQLLSLCIAFEAVLHAYPDLATHLPAGWEAWAFVVILVARLKKQGA